MIAKPEIYKTLVVSTGHIQKKDYDLLMEGSVNPAVVFYSYEYGWNVHVPEDVEERKNQIIKDGWSKDFLNLMFTAKEHGCAYLSLDCDGNLYDELPQFDW